MLDEAMERLEVEARLERQVRKAIQSFNEGDYASALYSFYRLQESDENGRNYERHIVNSWFNWGATLLKEGAVDEAREKFVEARDIMPNDSDTARAIKIIDRYENRIVDEAFDSFVESLRLRTIQ
jgi:tetratricopeptide (TPR) repeat protein